jgi:large subunit ribosomal protein L15
MNLSNLRPAKGAVKDRKRIGRGQGSGMGGTSTRGHKGAQSRSGYSQKLHFEGGQMPLQRRVPKFGFKNINRVEYKAINLDAIQALVEKTGVTLLDANFFQTNGLVGKRDLVKILGRGELTSAIEIHAHGFSGSAKEAIEKAGGKTVLIADLIAADKASKAEAMLAATPVVDKKEAKPVAVAAPVEVAPAVAVVAEAAPVVEASAPVADEASVAEAPATEAAPDTQGE